MATPVGGAQSAHTPSDSLSGRNQTIPAIPAVNGGASFNQDHSRKPSMTVTPAGANFNPNGSAGNAAQNKPNVQFGNIQNAQGGSPAPGNPALAHQTNNSLGVNQLNPNQRAASPQGSPSPIPQPRETSGGVPAYGSQGNGMVFGQQPDQNDHSVIPVDSNLYAT
jgi:translation initiation factor 4G